MTHRLALAFPSGQLLRASVSGPADDRIREGLLVPFDEPGRTNLGRGIAVRPQFAAGLAQDAKVVGIYGHNREASVSRLLSWQATAAGVWSRIYVNRTALGDQLLAEIDGGARDGLSIEAEDLQFDSAGHIIAGTVDFYAHVPVGAYSSARIHLAAPVTTTPGDSVTLPTMPAQPAAQPALAAAHAGPPLPQLLQANLTAQPAQPAQPATPAAPAVVPTTVNVINQEPAATAAPALDLSALQSLVAGLQALQAGAHVAPPAQAAQPAGPTAAALLGTPAVPPAPAATGPASDPIADAARLQAAVAGGDYSLVAALQDITHSGLPMFQRPAGTIGQKLWEGSSTVRNWVDLTDTSTPLTSMKFTTWQWTRGPEVKAWDGDKNEVPSNPVSLEEIPGTARRCAGGWDVDRAYRDFGTTEFWTEFYKEQTESYRELTNIWAAQALMGFALDVSVDANVPASYLEVDRTVDAGPVQVLKAAALGTAILEDTPRVRQGPDWVAMNTHDWLTLIDVANLDLPSFLALLKIRPENFMRSGDVPQGQVVCGVKRAAKTRELGNGAPIRVEALDVARGGIDSAVYGYVGYSLERPGGIISVPLAASVAP